MIDNKNVVFGNLSQAGVTVKQKQIKPPSNKVSCDNKKALTKLHELSNKHLNSNVKITQTHDDITTDITIDKTVKQDITDKIQFNTVKTDNAIYSTSKHKPTVNCKIRNIDGFVIVEGEIKEIPIIQCIHNCKGNNYRIRNNIDYISLSRSQKIITFRNTDIGLTDNTYAKHITETLGYPYKRQIITKQIDTSKDLEINYISKYYFNDETLDKADNNRIITLKGYNKHKQLKQILDNTFINRVVRLYYKMYFDINNANTFRYSDIVKSLKSIDGHTVVRFLKQIINWVISNKTNYTSHKNGLYRYNITHLKYTLNDISVNGLLDKNYILSNKTHKTGLNDKTVIQQDKVKTWLQQNKKQLIKQDKYLKTISA